MVLLDLQLVQNRTSGLLIRSIHSVLGQMFQVGSDGSDPLQLDHLDFQSTEEPECMLGRCHDNRVQIFPFLLDVLQERGSV